MIIFRRKRKTNFIARFDKTPEAIACPSFWYLKTGLHACPYGCAYCYLLAISKKQGKIIYDNLDKAKKDVEKWLLKQPSPEEVISGDEGTNYFHPRVLNTGELLDSLAIPEIANFHTSLIPLFASERSNPFGHNLLFLSKSDNHGWFLNSQANKNVVLSYSVNSSFVTTSWEGGVKLFYNRSFPSLWRLRFRIDPIIPHPHDWKLHYKKVIDYLSAWRPERITLGTLRFSKNVKKHYLKELTQYTTELDQADYKWRLPLNDRADIYRWFLDSINPSIEVGICKEEKRLFEALGMKAQENKCNCVL